MGLALLGFFGIWFGWRRLLFPGSFTPGADICLHVLLAAYFAHLAARTIYLTAAYKKEIRV